MGFVDPINLRIWSGWQAARAVRHPDGPLQYARLRFGKGLAKQIYHSGRSEDVFESIKVIKKEHPESPIVLIGFSLGGNIVLKMAGELGVFAKSFIRKSDRRQSSGRSLFERFNDWASRQCGL